MVDDVNAVKQGIFGSHNAPAQPAKQESSGGLGGLFGGSKKDDVNLSESLASLSTNVNDLNRRIIVIEERSNDFRKQMQVTEQNMLTDFKKVHHNVRTFSDELMDVKKEISEIKSKMMLIIKELKLTARREDVETLNKYINLWEPVNFVTQNEVERIVIEKVTELVGEGIVSSPKKPTSAQATPEISTPLPDDEGENADNEGEVEEVSADDLHFSNEDEDSDENENSNEEDSSDGDGEPSHDEFEAAKKGGSLMDRF